MHNDNLPRQNSAWRGFKAYRLIQFYAYISNRTLFGSTHVSIDHKIADINSKPSSSQVIITPIENISVSKISSHIHVSSPIVFILPHKPIDTNLIEYYLINSAHKSSIYFTNDIKKIPSNYSFLKTLQMQTNSIKQNTVLHNIIGTINLSKNKEQNVILITASYDTFSAAPSLHVGASNGISVASFLEIIHILSKHYLPQNYAFVFAMTGGRFCGMEGIQHFLENNKIKFDFAISIESIFTPILHGHLGMKFENTNFQKKLNIDSIKSSCNYNLKEHCFQKFLFNLKRTLDQVNIPLEIKLSDSQFSQLIFNHFQIPSVAISGGPLYSSLTDNFLNVSRSDNFTWAFSEALFRTMYDLPIIYEVVDKKIVNTSFWANSIGNTPRLAPFIDKSLPEVFRSWMNSFTDEIFIEEWESKNCYIPYSSTDCILKFYNPIPKNIQFVLIIISILYGLCIYFIIAGCSSFHSIYRNMWSCITRPFCFHVRKRN
ncbi:hypothetical protein M9Y10_004481 [Tritrichomonas musculus]|uniref:BOS complex subunit NCLN n=1 Tax=Tritrichomonas musculus TaxID=1915356 RepID=A0ABR2JTF9_9EUKA